MPEMQDDHLEFLSVILLMSEKSDLLLDSIEKKLLENPDTDQILVNAKALLSLHLILSTYKSLTSKLVEENEQLHDNLNAFVENLLNI